MHNFIPYDKKIFKIMKILIICTGNSCRSQMAEGFLRSIDCRLEVFSAGIKPAEKVNPNAVKVMKEIGIDISKGKPENITKYADKKFDYAITVCDNAAKSCIDIMKNVKNKIHLPFEDPFDANGTSEEILATYRKVRDEIKLEFYKLYKIIQKEI